MSDLTLIGLGAMGSALARCWLDRGTRLTLWNRTPAKAERFLADGAEFAASPADAIAASPITIVCVDDYRISSALLEGEAVSAALQGRLLVQLSTGAPNEARALDTRVRAAGGEYLDGAIIAFPAQIGTEEACIIYSGEARARSAAETQLRLAAPRLDYLGAAIGAASAQDCAVAAYFAGGLLGALHGAAICEAEGLSVEAWGAQMAAMSPLLGGDVAHLARCVAHDEFSRPYASLKTWTAAITRLSRHAHEQGLDTEIPDLASRLFTRGLERGLGPQEVASLITLLRAPAKAR